MSRQHPIEKVNLAEKFNLFEEHWSPKIAGEVNDSYVKLVKFTGEFVWHHHEAEDEMFLVVKGSMTMKLRDRDIEVGEGEFIIVPRGVEHMPVANEEAHVILFEPKTVLNTGNVTNERTRPELERV
ncbi:MAG TPA: cupin domain-containing protein [Pyrinomonadaceae bacterium]|nr:cupin domain-containing protein [Pyrinomonadaceae bacterium]